MLPILHIKGYYFNWVGNRLKNKQTKGVFTMQMSDMVLGISVLVVVFFLVMLLGLQIQISALTRRIDEVLDKLRELNNK